MNERDCSALNNFARNKTSVLHQTQENLCTNTVSALMRYSSTQNSVDITSKDFHPQLC